MRNILIEESREPYESVSISSELKKLKQIRNRKSIIKVDGNKIARSIRTLATSQNLLCPQEILKVS